MSTTDGAPGGVQLPPAVRRFTTGVALQLRRLVGSQPQPTREMLVRLAERPGKCLRSALLGASAGLGTHDQDRAARLGVVVELVHMASLFHDDVIDRADTRRGLPAARVVAGDDLAVLAGLACFALAGTEAADLGARVDRMVSRTVAELAYGEMLDVERAFDTEFALSDYLELVERKTGALFGLCCVLGGEEAGLGPDEVSALARFGACHGVAFQIQDDCLDLELEQLDKPTGVDQLLGLFGAPTLCALAEDRGGGLAELLLSPAFGETDPGVARSLVVELGGLVAARELASGYRRRALDALDLIEDGVGREALAQTAVAATGRVAR